MEIRVSTQDIATVVKISGSLDGNTVNEAQDKVMPLLNGKVSRTAAISQARACGFF